MTDQDLVRLPPAQARKQFVESRKGDIREATMVSQSPSVERFTEWCEQTDRDLNQLTGLDIQQFYDQLQSEGYARTTLHHYTSVVRQFLLYLERIEVVPPGIGDKVHRPALSKHERTRDAEIDPDRVKDVVAWLARFNYASRDHIVMLLLWRCGLRTGSLRSIDLDDVTHLDGTGPVIDLHHRPGDGTPLKNGIDGERPINLTEETAAAVDAYIEHHRIDATDAYGRRPLITSEHGRYSQDQIRKVCLYYTCPETTGIGTCDCEDQHIRQTASDCAQSVSPHTIRAASITYWRQQDIPVEVVSDRMNVSRQVLENHYDRRTKEGKARQRKQYLDNI
jgi:integrase